jgi:glycosyltransferase involved in cell wall biosynthesis
MSVVVHISHEATHKIGGIGTVLEGLLSSPVYRQGVERSILVGTWSLGLPLGARLGDGGRVLYSLCDGVDEDNWRNVFRPVEEKYHVWITYGTRRFEHAETGDAADVEVLLIEASETHALRLNYFKATMYQRFGIAAGDYEAYADFEHWMRVAEPAYEATMALLGEARDTSRPVFFISHEYMGMPTVLKAAMERAPGVYTALYAHEVAAIRPHVENHAGHDTRFYNLMAQARARELYIHDVLGSQWHFYRHALTDRAQFCDAILAVGDWVVSELRFLGPAFETAPIHLVYNGIPAFAVSLEAKKSSKARLASYCDRLLGYTPDYVFTHVTRMVLSKGLWRDVRVLEHLDRHLANAGKSAVFFVLSSEIGPGRPSEVAWQMEADYGWPVVHREGYPDLVGLEVGFNHSVAAFNLRSRAIKVVFVNQFGWSRERCGSRFPEEMEFLDIRQGTDAEFGQSIYEPFGIAQVESLSFGAICVLSSVCGCLGFVRKAAGDGAPNVLVADYTALGGGYMGVEAVAQIGWAERDAVEMRNSAAIAEELARRLPRSDADVRSLLERGYQIARHMSWDVVVDEYFLPALDRARTGKT